MSASIVPQIGLHGRPVALTAPIAFALARRLAALAEPLRRAWRRRRARHALEAMGERGLADLGIGPSGIEHAVRHGRGDGAARRRSRCEDAWIVRRGA